MNRARGIDRIKSETLPWDIVIIGGGATGLGCALDSVSRGYRTLLLEQADFSNGTSSRSTKLIHGGVRYLRQGNVSLVKESLAERGWLLNHVPHLVTPQPFLIPTYSWAETWYYRVGLWMYDRLAGSLGIHSSKKCNKGEALAQVPTLRSDTLAGGVVYWDGQFDDARLCMQTVKTIWRRGHVALNHMQVTDLVKEGGRVCGVKVHDKVSDETLSIHARVVIHATGIFSDTIREQDTPNVKPIIRSSRGSHLVVDGDFLPNGTAVMVPKTSDGRLLFLVPWLNKVIIGTTDVPDDNLCLEPKPTDEEIDFMLENAAPYLNRPIERKDIRSVYSGLRPLVRDPQKQGDTSALSRNHVIEVSPSGLITIAGGKWTTFRKMGEDAINKAIEVGQLAERASRSMTTRYSAYDEDLPKEPTQFGQFGIDARHLRTMISWKPKLGDTIHERLPYTWAEVLWAIENELVESVDDVLARRTRALLLDAQAAMDAAPAVARFMAKEMGRDENWVASSVDSFIEIAKNYIPKS